MINQGYYNTVALIKVAWLPPKRVRGILSPESWDIMRNRGVFGTDDKLYKGLLKRQKNLLSRDLSDYELKSFRLRDMFKVNEDDRESFIKLLNKGELMDPVRKKIITYHPDSRFYNFVNWVEGNRGGRIENARAIDHELNEAKAFKKGLNKGFVIRGRGGEMLANHADPSVVLEESNSLLRFNDKGDLPKVRTNSKESFLIKDITGKEYGRQWFTEKDSEMIRNLGNEFRFKK